MQNQLRKLFSNKVFLLSFAFAFAFVFLIVAPYFLDNYWLRIFTNMFMFAILAASWNIIAGYCGYAAFGNVVFFGVGSYTTAVLMVNQVDFFLSILIAALVCALYAATLGLPILRLKGHYFAVATIGINEGTRELINNMEGLTHGAEGLSLPMIALSPKLSYVFFYFLMLIILIIVIALTYFLTKSRVGFAFRSIRSNEEAALVTGINAAYYKTIAWAVSAFFTGLTGGVYAYWVGFIDTESVFSISITVKMIVMALVGGLGTILGPVIGAFIFELISETLWSTFTNFHAVILGAMIMIIVLFIPGGLVELIKSKFSMAAFKRKLKESKV